MRGDVRGKLNEQSKPVITIWSRDLLALSAIAFIIPMWQYTIQRSNYDLCGSKKSLQENYSKEGRRKEGTEGKETIGERVWELNATMGGDWFGNVS